MLIGKVQSLRFKILGAWNILLPSSVTQLFRSVLFGAKTAIIIVIPNIMIPSRHMMTNSIAIGLRTITLTASISDIMVSEYPSQ